MRQIIIIFTIFTLSSCDLKSSTDYNEEAIILQQEGKFSEAIILLDKAIEKDPNNIYALINRGVNKSMLGDYKGSIEDHTRVIEIDSDNTLAFLNRGKSKKSLEDYKGAIEDFEKAIKTKGNEMLYIDLHENSMVETGFEFDVAMEQIRFERGVARYYIDSLGLAFDDFDFCIQKNFEKPASFFWRGLIYISYGMYNEGCADLNEAQKMGDPDAMDMIHKYCE